VWQGVTPPSRITPKTLCTRVHYIRDTTEDCTSLIRIVSQRHRQSTARCTKLTNTSAYGTAHKPLTVFPAGVRTRPLVPSRGPLRAGGPTIMGGRKGTVCPLHALNRHVTISAGIGMRGHADLQASAFYRVSLCEAGVYVLLAVYYGRDKRDEF
jgi:hypothetical protein